MVFKSTKSFKCWSKISSAKVFQGVVGGANNTKIRVYTILEQSKETMLEFPKGTAKVF